MNVAAVARDTCEARRACAFTAAVDGSGHRGGVPTAVGVDAALDQRARWIVLVPGRAHITLLVELRKLHREGADVAGARETVHGGRHPAGNCTHTCCGERVPRGVSSQAR